MLISSIAVTLAALCVQSVYDGNDVEPRPGFEPGACCLRGSRSTELSYRGGRCQLVKRKLVFKMFGKTISMAANPTVKSAVHVTILRMRKGLSNVFSVSFR